MSEVPALHVMFTGNSAFKVANFRAGLIRTLIAEGHKVSVFAPRDDYTPALVDMGCAFVPLAMQRKGTSAFDELAVLYRFRQTFARLRPDVVLGFTIKNNIYGALAAKSLGIAFIPNVTGLGHAFTSETLLKRVAIFLKRRAFRSLPVVFCQNPVDRSVLVKERIISDRQARLLPGSGVDLHAFAPVPLPSAKTGGTFLLAARMLWDKGVAEFVEAARMLRKVHSDARFVLVGPVEPPSRNAIPEEQLRAWGRLEGIEYRGAVRDIRSSIAACDCLVLPSYYREGTPRILLEAAAMARPIITTDMPGCRDTIIDGKTGYYCAAGNPADLAGQLDRILRAGHAKRTEMGRLGRALMIERFDENIVIGAYRSAITEAARRPRQGCDLSAREVAKSSRETGGKAAFHLPVSTGTAIPIRRSAMVIAIRSFLRRHPKLKRAARRAPHIALSPYYRLVGNPMRRLAHANRSERRLEIGPGPDRLAGFETLNIRGGRAVDYVYNAANRLPFGDDTFALIYASHIIEHIPWYRTATCLSEWRRIIKPGGALEIWVPDGLKIAEAFVTAERSGSSDYLQDDWDRFNEARDPCLWANGRLFSYGDGSGAQSDPNWHMAMFSERYLSALLRQCGFRDVSRLERSEVRGYDHGWINLGLRATK